MAIVSQLILCPIKYCAGRKLDDTMIALSEGKHLKTTNNNLFKKPRCLQCRRQCRRS